MRIPTYIQRSRHGIFFFRMVVPKALRETFDGQTEVKRSLHTRNLREAMRVARPLGIQLYELFARLEAGMSTPKPTVADILAKAKAGELRDLRAVKSLTLPDGTKHSYDLQTDSNDPAEIAAFERQVAREQELMSEAEARYREKPMEVPEAMLDYQQKQALELATYKAQLAEERAARERAEARAEVRAEVRAAIQNIAVQPAAPQAVATAAQATGDDLEEAPQFKPNPDNTISKRWAEYVGQTAKVNWTGGKTTPGNERRFKEFREWWGADDDIRAITRKRYNAFINYLLQVRVQGAGAKKGQPGLEPRTVDNYTSVINTFLEWAQNKGYFPDSRRLPTAGQFLVPKSARKANSAKANPPYTLHQLQTLLNPNNFKPKLAHHFWPPFIALFSGGRRREIAQLLVHDFTVIDGIPSMSIDDLGDVDKGVKSQAARRTIPVHPELIRMGLLDYVADTKALNLSGELFPGIGVDTHGMKGNAIGNAWRRHREAFGMAGERAPTFHSFRATAIKVLKRNGVELEIRCQLVGHDLDHTGEVYDMTPRTVKELWEKGTSQLVYDGLDLSGFTYTRGQFDESNRHEHKKTEKREARMRATKVKKAEAVAAAQKQTNAGKAKGA